MGAFQAKVDKYMSRLLGRHLRWLAVHIRRSDKACEAEANFELSDADILRRICSQCKIWSCQGVFLCSDDAVLKRRLQVPLTNGTYNGGVKLAVTSYDATLSE